VHHAGFAHSALANSIPRVLSYSWSPRDPSSIGQPGDTKATAPKAGIAHFGGEHRGACHFVGSIFRGKFGLFVFLKDFTNSHLTLC
jgi:hypothetical protein